ncbi:hypothetical protein TSAR_011805 [Trichomalopsis sarcophagae]|uniref:C2H2-type domain-containing protein n=1 Tax=Trichomalopsis sarcophagae TaxID=543379 RepID=A0A232F5Y3_9HYME|nr:hypothetical protein TSAR_011805 [Trichomalopsis sarcophagae]
MYNKITTFIQYIFIADWNFVVFPDLNPSHIDARVTSYVDPLLDPLSCNLTSTNPYVAGIENSASRAPKKKNRNKGRYNCPNCDAVYNRSDNMRQHLTYACNKQPRFGCPYCSQRRKRTCEIYQHVRRLHSELAVACIDLEDPTSALLVPK